MEESFREKFSNYEDLRSEVSKFYEETVIYPIVIGLTGQVHKQTNNFFMKCGLPQRKEKGLCKWMSNSNIIFARNIWNSRCKLVKDFLFLLYLMCSFYSYFHKTLNSSRETTFLTQLDDSVQ